jgi:hypothetical protein
LILLGGRSLVTIGNIHSEAVGASSRCKAGLNPVGLVKVTMVGQLLAHASVPTGLLVRRHAVLTVKVVDGARVLIQRVTINLELNFLHKPLTGKGAPTHSRLIAKASAVTVRVGCLSLTCRTMSWKNDYTDLVK